MDGVKWIKVYTDIFNNQKIIQIEAMPESDAIIVIWLKLLLLAGTINDDGRICLTDELPYTDQMLATYFHKPIATVQLALRVFEKFKMIEIVDDVICVSNWKVYQNIDGMDKIREQNRIRKQKQREKEKLQLETDMSRDSHVTVTEESREVTHLDKDIDIDKEKDSYLNTSCSEPSPEVKTHEPETNTEPPKGTTVAKTEEPLADVPTIYLTKGIEWRPTQTFYNEMCNSYPGLNVYDEFRKMHAWSLSNKSRRKTLNGAEKFVNNWLSNKNDSPQRYTNYYPSQETQQLKGMAAIDEMLRESLDKE